MPAPPVVVGAENATVAWLLPAVAAPMVGAPGTVAVLVGLTVGVLVPLVLPPPQASNAQTLAAVPIR